MEQVRVLSTSIKHGKGYQMYELPRGKCIPADFFSKEEIDKLISVNALEYIKPIPDIQKLAKPIPEEPKIQLQDLSTMSVANTIEFLDTVVDAVQLEKYLDQEEGQKSRVRKRVTKFIENRIKDLQGTE